MFGSNYPYGGNVSQYSTQMNGELDRLNNLVRQNSTLEKIETTLNSLTIDQLDGLSKNPVYVKAQQMYNANLMDYISSQYKRVFADGPGKQCVENLYTSLTQAISDVNAQKSIEDQKVRAMLELIESDPDMRDKVNKKLSSADDNTR